MTEFSYLLICLALVALPSCSEAALIYSNDVFACAQQECALATQSCVEQSDCNTILACRDNCYSSHANDKLSEVACLEACQASSSSNGLTLFNQYNECYMMLCPEVYQSELCNGYQTQSLCEDQVGCTFLPNEMEMCQYGDFQPPEFTVCEIGIVKSARENGPSQTVSWRTIEANDENLVTITQTKGLSSGSDFPIGDTEIQYIAVDESGNYQYCNFTVSIIDTTAPVFESCPQSRTIRPTRNDIMIDEFQVPRVAVPWVLPVIYDNVGAHFAPSSPNSTIGIFIAGEHNITYTAVDAAGNEAFCTFSIVIEPAPTTYFTVSQEKSVSNPVTLLSFPLGVSTDACADRCLSQSSCTGFVSDLEGIGRCTLFSGYDELISNVATNVYTRQPYSVFECLYDDILACPYTEVSESSNCTADIDAYESCVTPLLNTCHDEELVFAINTRIRTDKSNCTGFFDMESYNATSPFECGSLVASLSPCFGCCRDAYNTALEPCQDLMSAHDACVADRYGAFDVCAGVCIDARTTSTPVPPVPSNFLDITLPLEFVGVGDTDLDNVFQARIIASVATVFGFDEEQLHLNITSTSVSSITAIFSIRIPYTYSPPDTTNYISSSSGSSSPARRRRTAADVANIATFFKTSSNVDVLVSRLSSVLLASVKNLLSVSLLNGGLVADVPSDASALVDTTPASTLTPLSTTSMGTGTTIGGSSTVPASTIPPPVGPNASGTNATGGESIPVIAIAVLGAVIFVVILVILVRSVTRKRHRDHKRKLPTSHPVARKSVRGGTFGNNRHLPDIIGNKQSGTPKKNSVPRPQPPEKLPAMSRPSVQDPFTREPGQKGVRFSSISSNNKNGNDGKTADVMVIPEKPEPTHAQSTTSSTTSSTSSPKSSQKSKNDDKPKEGDTASTGSKASKDYYDDDDDDEEEVEKASDKPMGSSSDKLVLQNNYDDARVAKGEEDASTA